MVRHRQPVDTQWREKQRDDMQCECLREKKKSALKHSIIYVPAASLSPQPLLLERERESQYARQQTAREDSSLLKHSTARFLERREAENHLLLLHPCVCSREAGGHNSSVSISRGSVLDLPKCSTTSLNAKRETGDPTVRVSGLILQLGVCVRR